MNYLVLELHKQEPWYSNKIVGFKSLPLIGVNASLWTGSLFGEKY